MEKLGTVVGISTISGIPAVTSVMFLLSLPLLQLFSFPAAVAGLVSLLNVPSSLLLMTFLQSDSGGPDAVDIHARYPYCTIGK
jgi:hypothetical protein